MISEAEGLAAEKGLYHVDESAHPRAWDSTMDVAAR